MRLPAGDRELVQIMDASFADAARRAGEWLACRPGCTQCCHGAFAIDALDAARLRAGMETLRHDDAARAEAVERRALAWIAEHGPAFPGDVETGRLGTSDEDCEAFENYANDAACPALDPRSGRCDLYAWRPMTCRVFGPPVRVAGDEPGRGALGCCELCFVGVSDKEIAACEMQAPHELEQQLLGEAVDEGETVVAFAVLKRDTETER